MELFDTSPELTGEALFSVHIDERDSRIVLGFESAGLPSRPRREWVEQGLNAFEIHLTFFGVRDLVLEGWTGSPEHTVHFGWLGERSTLAQNSAVRMEISGTGELICFTAQSVKLTNVRAYRASQAV
ncbi:Imm50 family immunity protein [Streptomyces sp. S07_1.15]|uniref:Imm50 family immunity protein n=1 Tax=Streptomyces sp. S07_1.15 TaxID=2873925 RepID=UPI0027E1CF4E|nr:Imm50 family immunity protein [Streptomyces sp. S07_1.15]